MFHLQGQSRVRDVGQHQLSSQGGLAEYHPRPMHSPPPLRRANLPLFTTTYNSANPTPPLLNTLAHTPPLFLDAVEGGSSLAHRDTQSLQTDTRSVQLAADCDMNTGRWFEQGQRVQEMTGGWRVGRLQTRAGILWNTDIMMPQTAPVIVGSQFQLRSEIFQKSCWETSQLVIALYKIMFVCLTTIMYHSTKKVNTKTNNEYQYIFQSCC